MDINKHLNELNLDQSSGRLSTIFNIDESRIDEFASLMASKGPEMSDGDMTITDVISLIANNLELHTIEDLALFMFIGGMGFADQGHKTDMQGLRDNAIDLAIKMKQSQGPEFKPSDLVDAEALRQAITSSNGKEF